MCTVKWLLECSRGPDEFIAKYFPHSSFSRRIKRSKLRTQITVACSWLAAIVKRCSVLLFCSKYEAVRIHHSPEEMYLNNLCSYSEVIEPSRHIIITLPFGSLFSMSFPFLPLLDFSFILRLKLLEINQLLTEYMEKKKTFITQPFYVFNSNRLKQI